MLAPAPLEIAGVSKRYGRGPAILDEVSLSVRDGEVLAVIGPNGAGKSTLLAIVSGRLREHSGQVRLFGEDVTRLRPDERVARGMVQTFQRSTLFDQLSVANNVVLAVQRSRGIGKRALLWRRKFGDVQLAAEEAVASCGLESRLGSPAAALSHGERRQLEVALALACSARLLLLDEPMAGLSALQRDELAERIAGLRGRHSVVLVEHDLDIVRSLADRVAVLVAGHLVITGTFEEVSEHPDVVEGYLGSDWRAAGSETP